MTLCSACRAPVPEGARFCPECGAPAAGADVAPDPAATIASPRTATSTPSSSAPLPGAGRYAPGAMILDRYRIVGLLGRGGMGEVYRADDLTLGQAVALKFLPESVAADPDRRDRFYGEVRVARQVAHPNVCRVYDIGEVDGRAFLSMEFVDGEDLASLLRRIGRLPQEKAVEISRQLCAGLGALHDRGVLHRDLKPANVMVDGRGGVRITDFGLSALAEEIGADVRVGTPAYMSPEQLGGDGVDARSDLYALGLTLYELFTGRQAFVADSVVEMARLHRETTPTSPSEILPDLDPAVERVIARCLEKDPTSRPPSAISVAAALPGGDPLAAALAAGEIPSLEMVAAAGERGGVRTLVGIACVAAVIVALGLYARVNVRGKVSHYDPLEKPPAVLVDRAQDILTGLGHDEPFQDSAHGLATYTPVLAWLAREDTTAARWDRLRDARPPGVRFWYRQSPRPLLPQGPGGVVNQEDPPVLLPGMASVYLDTSGRLLSLQVIPAQKGDSTAAPETDWDEVLRLAGLDPGELRRVDPEWIPPVHADERVAWVGTLPGEDGLEMRFEGAALAGRPVHFRSVGPWTEPFRAIEEEDDPLERWGQLFLLGIITFILFGGAFLAFRNVRMGRGDLKSARRLSAFVAVLLVTRWALVAQHTGDFNDELNEFLLGVAMALLVAATVWCFYLALEPYVRKWWPEQLVAWSRVLTGRWRDPIVGRDILVGGVFLLFLTIPDAINLLMAQAGGRPPATPAGYSFMWLSWLGPQGMAATTLSCFLDAIFYGMFFLLCILFLRFLVRSQRAALAVFALAVGFVYFTDASTNDGNRIVATAVGVGSGVGYSFVLHRFGLLPFIVGFFLRNLTTRFPVAFDGGTWYSGSSVFVVLVILGIAGWGLWTALAGRSVLRDWLADDE